MIIFRLMKKQLYNLKFVWIIGLGVFIAVFQQWCGINVIFNYAEEIFRSAGYDVSGMMFNVVVTGLVNLVFTFVAIACYAMTLAPVTWVLLSEIFPNRIRGAAMSIAVSALWIACFGLTVTFKPINAALGAAGTFWMYGVISLIGFIVMWLKVPETKGKSLEEIERELTRA